MKKNHIIYLFTITFITYVAYSSEITIDGSNNLQILSSTNITYFFTPQEATSALIEDCACKYPESITGLFENSLPEERLSLINQVKSLKMSNRGVAIQKDFGWHREWALRGLLKIKYTDREICIEAARPLLEGIGSGLVMAQIFNKMAILPINDVPLIMSNILEKIEDGINI